jgi:hypothetical protein
VRRDWRRIESYFNPLPDKERDILLRDLLRDRFHDQQDSWERICYVVDTLIIEQSHDDLVEG